MLSYNPSERITISQISQDEWFLEPCEFNTPEEVKKFLEAKKEKKGKSRATKPKAMRGMQTETGCKGGTPDSKAPTIEDDIFIE